MDALREDIPKRVAQLRTPLRFGDLVQQTANETPARLKQLQEAVFALEKERNLIVRTKAGALRRNAHSLADDDVIELPTQMWLIPN